MLSPSDGTLMNQIQSTNNTTRQQGWGDWYARDREFLLNYVKRHFYKGSTRTCDLDIVQDCFLIAFKKIVEKQYEHQGKSLRGYLCGIGKNLIYAAIRLQNKEITDERYLDQPVTPANAIDEKIDIEAVLAWVAAARYNQPWQNLQVLNGYYSQGISSKALGQQLNKSASNIRIINYRSVNQIQEEVARHHNLTLSTEEIRTFLQVL